jgi:hypothetical protein
MLAEPIRERIDFAERAQTPHGNSLHCELLLLKQNKEMTVRRRDGLRHLEEIDGLRQAQFPKPANLKPANAEQDARRNTLLQKPDRKDFARFKTSQNKDGIGVRRRIGAGQPIENELEHQRLRIAKS